MPLLIYMTKAGLAKTSSMTDRPERSLRSRAVDYLSRREYSRAELKKKLMPFEEDIAVIDALLDDLAQREWQSDSRYAEMMVHSKSYKHGNRRLRQALSTNGVDDEIIQDVLPSREEEQEAAINVLHKKFKQSPTSREERAKQMRFLAYRGFGMDAISAAMDSWREWDSDFRSDFDDFGL